MEVDVSKVQQHAETRFQRRYMFTVVRLEKSLMIIAYVREYWKCKLAASINLFIPVSINVLNCMGNPENAGASVGNMS